MLRTPSYYPTAYLRQGPEGATARLPRARMYDMPTMYLQPARVNAARTDVTTTVPALGLRCHRQDQPPANRVRPAQTTTRDIQDGRTRRRGNLAISCVTWHSISKHSEEV